MSFLSAQGQLNTYQIPVLATGNNDGVASDLYFSALPVGQYVCSVMSGVVGGGVTGGTIFATTGGVDIASTPVGAPNTKGTLTFIFTSNGTTQLSIELVGVGGNWTSVPTTLYILPVP
jgi:hypothetical protein